MEPRCWLPVQSLYGKAEPGPHGPPSRTPARTPRPTATPHRDSAKRGALKGDRGPGGSASSASLIFSCPGYACRPRAAPPCLHCATAMQERLSTEEIWWFPPKWLTSHEVVLAAMSLCAPFHWMVSWPNASHILLEDTTTWPTDKARPFLRARSREFAKNAV